MGLFKKYINQTRKPEGFLGKMMIGGMNGGHAKLADWGMSYLTIAEPSNIAELGCGGGRNTGELLKQYPSAKVTALDYSELSVEKTKDYNKDMIASGRCKVVQGNVAQLPFSDGEFELATAFETVYFWPGLEHCFAEVCRVLKSCSRCVSPRTLRSSPRSTAKSASTRSRTAATLSSIIPKPLRRSPI